ncbi:MAG: helix-turn-helix transcriptional regulator [Clostridiales bacterium]|nr:helix-turn-helix transcriptional regulator [Clostridiales bacterium]
MILADKIIMLRKKSGWSQEELANQMDVSRQSVSKWESAMSVPDLGKILKLSEIFGVSTDYLLKDEVELEEDQIQEVDTTDQAARRISLEQANDFLSVKEQTAKWIAFATFLCIISPIPLLLLSAASEFGQLSISDNLAVGLGLILLILILVPAVSLFIICGKKTETFEFLENESIDTAYGVSSMVGERRSRYSNTHTKYNVLGTCLCILSVIPIFVSILLPENTMQGFYMVSAVALNLLLVGIGVVFFIIAGINWASMQKLLEEGEYTKKQKAMNQGTENLSAVYWLIVTAIYLGYSLITDKWNSSWIIWPVAGVVFAALIVTYQAVRSKENKT